MRLLLLSLVTLLILPVGDSRGQAPTPDTSLVYKQIGDTQLRLHLFYPEAHSSQSQAAAVVFFFGGGWKTGTPEQFYPHARHYAERGAVGISAEYRVESRHGTTPLESVQDGKSAIRWIRSRADELGLDPAKIAAGGGSAGGHVAAAAGTVDGFDALEEDTTISARPNALILFNPVIENGPGGYGYDRVGDRFPQISPVYNVDSKTPPTILFLGSNDRLVPVSTARWWDAQMEEAGVTSELRLYEGQEHGFFNYRGGENEYYTRTVSEADWFLNRLGFLDDRPITPEEPIDLLADTDLSSFYTWIPETKYDDPERVFSLVRNIDGHPAIRISGEKKGSLITKRAFENYHLIAEYRWGPLSWEWNYGDHTRAHRARDNGIQIHCRGADGNWKEHQNAAFLYGIQYQLREGRIGDFILMGGWNEDGTVMEGPELTVKAVQGDDGGYRYHWNGDEIRMSDQRNRSDRVRQVHWYGYDPHWINLIGYRGRGDLERPPGEWNRVEIIAKEDSIIHKLNGAVINVGTDPSVTSGKILLQSEFAEIYYRRLELHPLD